MKLHELLAVATNLSNQATKCSGELAATFEKKRHLFEEAVSVFTPLAEGEKPVVESQSSIQSTVLKELGWISGVIAKDLDASLQIADANTKAKADIILESGEVLVEDVPATALLELEKSLQEILTLFSKIPTFDPSKGFSPDPNRGEGYYRAREVIKTRTKKTKRVLIKYDATQYHPAQTEVIDEDAPVGSLRQDEWSSLITPADKSLYLNRIDQLIRAVRAARSRANDQDVDKSKKIGNALFNFVLNPNKKIG